ncbi:hypothetical protein BGX27_009611 [Mortierella sp. AM989]|nr:hypothetical protein BGX27_009611 [Mortierella sp. AM989]
MGQWIPDCNGSINGTVQFMPPTGFPYQPDGSCNLVKKLNTIAPPPSTPPSTLPPSNVTGSGNQTAVGCIPPFIPDPMLGPGGTTTNSKVCDKGCCLPCPSQYSLYQEGSLDTGYLVSDIARIISAVLSLILMLSYIVLPDKLAHPTTIIFCQIISAFLFSAVALFSVFSRQKVQCVDSINPSTQQNNLRCAAQGTLQVFSAAAFCIWNTAVILNLHLHTVWGSAWFARNYVITHSVCWGIPAIITATALGMGQISWNTGSYCFISQSMASAIFFYPLAILLFPSFFLHISTFFHIARVTIQSSNESSGTSGSTSITGGGPPTISKYRHAMTVIKIQWRAALMASLAITLAVYYWLFYFFQFSKMNPERLRPNIENHFMKCLIDGGDQNSCVAELAPYLPSFAIMISAEVLVSTAGLVCFIIFFKPSLVREWRDFFGSVGYFLSRRGGRKDEEDFIPM